MRKDRTHAKTEKLCSGDLHAYGYGGMTTRQAHYLRPTAPAASAGK